MGTMTKTPHQKTTDTLRQALATLAALMDRTINEVNVLDSEIQDGIRTAVQETQDSLQKQAYDRQQAAVEEAVQKTRALVSEEFYEEMQKLTDECERAKTLLEKAKEEHLQELVDTEEAAAVANATPVGRWGGEGEIATAVIALIETNFITGETLRVDGGRHLA